MYTKEANRGLVVLLLREFVDDTRMICIDVRLTGSEFDGGLRSLLVRFAAAFLLLTYLRPCSGESQVQ